jgi:hypothetical protein
VCEAFCVRLAGSVNAYGGDSIQLHGCASRLWCRHGMPALGTIAMLISQPLHGALCLTEDPQPVRLAGVDPRQVSRTAAAPVPPRLKVLQGMRDRSGAACAFGPGPSIAHPVVAPFLSHFERRERAFRRQR